MFEVKHFTFLDRLCEEHPQVKAAVERVRAANVPWQAIIAAVLPFVAQLLTGKPLDLAALVQAILALLAPAKAQPA